MIERIKKELKKSYKLTDKEIINHLKKKQDQYFGLSTLEFIAISPEINGKIVLENIKSMKNREIMGA